MAGVVTISSIEGNSNLGVPVFSRSGRKYNYSYLVFTPSKEDSGSDELDYTSATISP